VFDRADALLAPTVPETAFPIGERLADPVAMRRSDRFTVPASLLGLPAVAVPCGEDDDGAPLSVQCVAPRGREDRALGLATRVERVLDPGRLRERSWWPRTGGGEA
jgi:aspartyl-tRNA(Asn)/glutamyl-tRNA(Gln) amidotransferase subunit A